MKGSTGAAAALLQTSLQQCPWMRTVQSAEPARNVPRTAARTSAPTSGAGAAARTGEAQFCHLAISVSGVCTWDGA